MLAASPVRAIRYHRGMLHRLAVVLGLGLGLFALGGCTHAPDTVVHLSAPSGAWAVRDSSGARLCSLPCKVELDADESVVVAREGGGQQFVVEQQHLGKGSWMGTVRVRKEMGAGALAVQAFSEALMAAGTTLIHSRREDKVAPGLVLTGLGTAGMLASNAMPGKPYEELWLTRTATP
jgi:hypothetical protein